MPAYFTKDCARKELILTGKSFLNKVKGIRYNITA